MDAGQSVLSMCRELAKCPDWAVALLEGKGMEVFGGGEAGNEMGAWTSVAECEAACQRNLDRFFKYILTFADAKLKDTVDLPFGKGGSLKVFTMAEIMDYPRWNATYHLGQIAYIQTLYGDKEMY